MIINGSIIKEAVLEELAARPQETQLRVCFVQFGQDAASTKFVGMKMAVAKTLGIYAEHVHSDAANTIDALAVLQEAIDADYDGIVVQLPVPEGIDATTLVNILPVEKDIDVLSTAALMAFATGSSGRMPPVAAAAELILTIYKVSLDNKKIVIRGKGKLVGETVMMLLDSKGVSYIAIDINTPEEEQLALLKEADVIVSGIGVPHSLTPDMVKEGVVLIDAGTSEQTGKLVGDIDPACAEKASLYTPVPGGVGPITVACLFRNLFL
ncbi:MAG: bifunctional 5,10-methylenetetrahydrofolate dehydrogenase/5,10-methenyltetrahydrofolate cyclohydrolase [Patescibacteria group bacterium]